MLSTELYIQGIGFISHAGFSGKEKDFQFEEKLQEPNYNDFIAPMQQRRMSKAVRMGIAAAKMCLHQAGITTCDAISMGTSLGCLNDTEFFLNKMVEQEEQMLTPTAFIQSTHNTVSGQIALLIGCHGHNLTFTHKSGSFAHALVNAQLYLKQHPDHLVLVGALDESTPNTIALMNQAGVPMNAEGAAFFLISAKRNEQTIACIESISLNGKLQTEISSQDIENKVGVFPTADAVALGIFLTEGKKNFSMEHTLCGQSSYLKIQ